MLRDKYLYCGGGGNGAVLGGGWVLRSTLKSVAVCCYETLLVS